MASESTIEATRYTAGSARAGSRLVSRLAGIAAGAGGVAVFAFVSQASTWAEYVRMVAGLLMVAGCAWAAGALVGFLFGYRTLSLPSGDAAEGVLGRDQLQYPVNTNLEQILGLADEDPRGRRAGRTAQAACGAAGRLRLFRRRHRRTRGNRPRRLPRRASRVFLRRRLHDRVPLYARPPRATVQTGGKQEPSVGHRIRHDAIGRPGSVRRPELQFRNQKRPLAQAPPDLVQCGMRTLTRRIAVGFVFASILATGPVARRALRHRPRSRVRHRRGHHRAARRRPVRRAGRAALGRREGAAVDRRRRAQGDDADARRHAPGDRHLPPEGRVGRSTRRSSCARRTTSTTGTCATACRAT